MEQTFFTMKPQLRGQMKYAILCLLPSIMFALLKQPLIAALVFVSLGAYYSLSKKHTVVVFPNPSQTRITAADSCAKSLWS